MTVLPRIVDAGELVKLRSGNQSTRLYLTVHSPTVLYRATLAAVPASMDQVASITYNVGGSPGTLANVLQDMTLLVGSTLDGYEYGIARIRKDGATLAGTFYIGETSEVNWQANCYLTVVDEFALWPRHVKIDTDGVTPLMDYDVAYTDENTAAGAIPTPVMGPHQVVWLRGSTVSITPDGTWSWVYDGTVTYSWAAPGASATANMTNAKPTITYNAAGVYRIALTVTGVAPNTKSFTGYRYVFVVTESAYVTTQFTLDSCSGDYSQGGWSFRVTCYAEATRALVRDRALVILHSVDYYGDTLGSVGYVAGSENIVAVGRIAGESIVLGAEDKWGTVTFDVEGPQYWLDKMTAFPSGVKDVPDATVPNKWTKFRGLTLYKAWYHWMRWRTTATRMMDVYANGEHRRHKRLESPGGQSIWEQLIEIGKRSMLADPCCDRYGRIWLEVNQQFVDDRSAMPNVMTLTSQDWQESINLERVTVDPVSLVDLSGTEWDGATVLPYFARSPGNIFCHYGSVEVVDRLMLVDQATTNTLAGLYSAWRNNPYPKVDIKFASNQRLIDIAPYQRMTLAIAAADTPRGVTETLILIPRSMSFEYDNTAGVMLTTGTFEAEVTADLAVAGDTPPEAPPPPVQPPIEPPAPPPIEPGLGSDAHEVWIATTTAIYWSGDFFNGGQPTWNVIAMPTGWTAMWRFNVAFDGSAIYMLATVSGKGGLWTCTNPRAASPTWTKILQEGDAGPTGDVVPPASGSFGSMIQYGNSVASVARCLNAGIYTYYQCVYDGSALHWIVLASPNTVLIMAYLAYVASDATHLWDAYTHAVLGTLLPQGNRVSSCWQNLIGGHFFYGGYTQTTGGYGFVYDVTASTQLTSNVAGNTYGVNGMQFPRGAYQGTEIDYVDGVGALWIATDGVTFVNKFTWGVGIVEQSRLLGGGSLIWLEKTVLANQELIRVSTNMGTAWTAMTGNFWSIASGNKTFINLQLVF
jgi:hypothetical protein